MFKLLYLPTGEYVNKYKEMPQVIDWFKTREAAQQAILDNRVIYEENCKWDKLFLNSSPVRKYVSGVAPHHFIEIIELPDV